MSFSKRICIDVNCELCCGRQRAQSKSGMERAGQGITLHALVYNPADRISTVCLISVAKTIQLKTMVHPSACEGQL